MREEILECIRTIHKESDGRYGALKIHKKLLELGYCVSLKCVKLLKGRNGIQSIITKNIVQLLQTAR
ncbi:IS3 family transposase [Sporosarcina sp. PTS2304]|uniref:IS3 family transposase n=1 Tax=Sporosarcina sp. PTS2304 TaxID=2283194 RepID=UPI0013B42BC1